MACSSSIVLSFRESISLTQEHECLKVLLHDKEVLIFKNPDNARVDTLNKLMEGFCTLDCLIVSARQFKTSDTAQLYFLIGMLEEKNLISYSLMSRGVKLATFVPTKRSLRLSRFAVPPSNFLLSRFALLRREGLVWFVECPFSSGHMYINNALLVYCVGLLASPQNTSSISRHIPELPTSAIEMFLGFLQCMNVIFECDESGKIAEDFDNSLQLWEHHDLLFHYHSRSGLHGHDYGATFRFKKLIPHSAAMKISSSEIRIPLSKKGNENLDCKFYDIIERRRSKRERGRQMMTINQLGFFLWHVARVKQLNPAESEGYESSFRPVPSGGAMHEIELYLTINRCAGIDQGFYRYNPLKHELERIAELGDSQKKLLCDAMNSANMTDLPDVLFTLASRFGRMSWKYEGMAYSTTLKNAGVIYNQMYLVATAMGLSPCALGGGDSEAFAIASNTCRYVEGSIGEFALSSSDDKTLE